MGSNSGPPLPFDNDTVVIAIEPIASIAAAIHGVPNMYVLTAAVASTWGVATFNDFADSSSLLAVNSTSSVAKRVYAKGRKGAKTLVPTLPLSAVLEASSSMDCWFLKIDAQGTDLDAVKSAKHHLERCSYVFAEVYCGPVSSYVGAVNNYLDWVPYMESMGFQAWNQCDRPGEWNILWKNRNKEVEDVADMKLKCPRCMT